MLELTNFINYGTVTLNIVFLLSSSVAIVKLLKIFLLIEIKLKQNKNLKNWKCLNSCTKMNEN